MLMMVHSMCLIVLFGARLSTNKCIKWTTVCKKRSHRNIIARVYTYIYIYEASGTGVCTTQRWRKRQKQRKKQKSGINRGTNSLLNPQAISQSLSDSKNKNGINWSRIHSKTKILSHISINLFYIRFMVSKCDCNSKSEYARERDGALLVFDSLYCLCGTVFIWLK